MQRLVSWPRADSTAWRAMGETMGCASRFHNRMNLQLCFINDSSSESDPEDEGQRSPADPPPQGPVLSGCRGALEREARLGLALVRGQLEQEQRRRRESRNNGLGPGVGVERALEHGDLLDMSLVHVQQLQVNILSQIHHFNGQLMELLESRDDLRTEQDAMLVEIGDLTH
ncbi:schwannomin-interacting protein 1-like isoform X3 [Rhinoraja longicauda]